MRGWLFCFLRDCVLADDWKGIIEDLKKTEDRIKIDLSISNSNTLEVVKDKLSEPRNQADESLAVLMQTKAGIEARTPLNGSIRMLTVLSGASAKPNN